ncbi:DUF397 domain-containing protein [Lipingzhangella sp. LS1_29]|uniref:DUF397 domain-containing protein n=1 Tax=Lipingzhangella rawalii TaxID=2055835 RepID=A0ABU2HB73_9ACTN|nr:DUF397 domain-containing protein [Lipingzhangella rawalii]MDS1272576.1 DUF397 domain-containing protein [Lipingzhangella rawalii]
MYLYFHKSSYSSSQENCVEVAPVLSFRKSSYSDSHDNCVEVAGLPTGVALRDSKHPEAGHVAVPADAWVSFLATLKGGVLDADPP